MERSKGIKVLAIIILVYSAYSLFSGIISFATISFFGGYDKIVDQVGYSKTYFVFSSIFSLFLEVVLLIGSIGLMKYKEWGRKMVMFAAIIGLLFGVFGFIYSLVTASKIFSIFLIFSYVLLIAGCIFLLIYLNRKSVRGATG